MSNYVLIGLVLCFLALGLALVLLVSNTALM